MLHCICLFLFCIFIKITAIILEIFICRYIWFYFSPVLWLVVMGFLRRWKIFFLFRYAIYIVKNLQSGFVFLAVQRFSFVAAVCCWEPCFLVASLGHYWGEFKWFYNVFLTLFGFATDISNIVMRLCWLKAQILRSELAWMPLLKSVRFNKQVFQDDS